MQPNVKTPSMVESMNAFPHQGYFQIELQKNLNTERMTTLCLALGIDGLGTIEETCRDGFSFTGMLISHGYIHEDKRGNRGTVSSRDATRLKQAAVECGYNDIIVLCNKWAGIEPNDGIVTELPEKPSDPNAVNEWCQMNKVTHLKARLLSFGFDSLEKIKLLDTQACIEMGIKGYDRISLMKKTMAIP